MADDALDNMIERQRQADPEFRKVYDTNHPRHALIARIVRTRLERGWTQRDLADAAGLKQPAVARLERGDTDPRWSTVVTVCAALELPLSVGDDDQRLVG